MNYSEIEPSYLLKVLCSQQIAEFMQWFTTIAADLGITWDFIKQEGAAPLSWVSVYRNDSHDPSRYSDEDGWYYYPYIIEVAFLASRENESDIKQFIVFAKELVSKLESKGCVVAFIGDLEQFL